MHSIEIKQITSKGDEARQAFFNVDDEHGYLNIWSSLYERETYIMTRSDSAEFHIVQFDFETSQERIREFFEDKKSWNVYKLEKDGFVTTGAK